MDESVEVVREFLVESHENLDQLDRDLVVLERDPDSRDLLSKLRDGQLGLRPDITTGLLSLVDAIRQMLDHIETVGSDGEAE